MYQIKTVSSKQEWSDFINFPWKIYKDDPNWVPPLKIAVRDLLDVNKNPFFKHGFMHPILVVNAEGAVVGRAVGIIDENHNKYHEEKTAFFGFFESIDDQRVAKTIFDEISRWSKQRGMTVLRGFRLGVSIRQ